MHYVGMLAYSLPVPVRYDWPTVMVSLIAAMVASGIALYDHLAGCKAATDQHSIQ